jgi:hypothetical protein
LKQPKSLIMIPNSEPSRAKTAQMPKPCILIKKFRCLTLSFYFTQFKLSSYFVSYNLKIQQQY